MKVKIPVWIEGKKRILKGTVQYAEGMSLQEKRPAFFLSIGKESVDPEQRWDTINFYADTVEEVDKFIESLQHVRDNFYMVKERKCEK